MTNNQSFQNSKEAIDSKYVRYYDVDDNIVVPNTIPIERNDLTIVTALKADEYLGTDGLISLKPQK